MEKFVYNFPGQRTVYAAQVNRVAMLPHAFLELDIHYPRPTLVMIGGAGGMNPDELDRLNPLFIEVLVPFAEARGIAIVDGGTDSGVMKLMGQARRMLDGTFPLIGVAATGTISPPGSSSTHNDSAFLEQHHSHFVLVPGSRWGSETPWIARVAKIIAGSMPSATILINGGEITLKDAAQSVKAKRPTIVIAGSGRAADQLTDALHGEIVQDHQINELVSSGYLQAINLTEDFDELNNVLDKIFSRE